jgi:drug/metabolite transporter (DMT)-like permease
VNISLGKSGTTLIGIALAVIAMVCFAALDTITKYVSTSVPVFMAIWFRYTVQAVLTTAVVLPLRGRAALRTAHPKFQVLRGVLLVSTSLLAFLSLKFMPVGEFTAVVMIAPLIITLLAATMLGEKVSPLRWALVAGGFTGTLVIIQPGHDVFEWHTLLPVALAFLMAWFQTLTSKLAKTEDPATMHLYTGWVGALIAALGLPFVWQSLPSLKLWGLMALIGVLGAVGHFLLILTPYLYTQIGFAMMGGWLVFSHVPDGFAFIGMTLIAVCGAAGAWLVVREGKMTIEPADS